MVPGWPEVPSSAAHIGASSKHVLHVETLQGANDSRRCVGIRWSFLETRRLPSVSAALSCCSVEVKIKKPFLLPSCLVLIMDNVLLKMLLRQRMMLLVKCFKPDLIPFSVWDFSACFAGGVGGSYPRYVTFCCSGYILTPQGNVILVTPPKEQDTQSYGNNPLLSEVALVPSLRC